jgi:hypothetical protein
MHKNIQQKESALNYFYFNPDNYPAKYNFEKCRDLYIKEQIKKVVKLIGENYDRFEYLRLDLCDGESERVVKYLRKYYPKVNIEQLPRGVHMGKNYEPKPKRVILWSQI